MSICEKMNDRELLEYAAKAVGLNIEWKKCASHMDDYELLGECGPFVNNSGWNPLTDDGDALRLAVRLQIGIHDNIVNVNASEINLVLAGIFIYEDKIHNDPYAATRRAIVRAAAEIGKSK